MKQPQDSSRLPHIRIERWKETKFWAVWIENDLLAVVCYKKGALKIKERLAIQ